MSTDLRLIEEYLHEHIPLTRAMQVAVESIDQTGVRLSAPLDPNINHRNTVFGGSASTLAILSAWTLIHTRLRDASYPSRIVIQRNTVEYLRPMHGGFEALCGPPTEVEWSRFLQSLSRRGRGRLTLRAEIFGDGQLAGRFEGVYVAMAAAEE